MESPPLILRMIWMCGVDADQLSQPLRVVHFMCSIRLKSLPKEWMSLQSLIIGSTQTYRCTAPKLEDSERAHQPVIGRDFFDLVVVLM